MTAPIGARDTRCAFQKETQVADGGGGYTSTWATQFSRWGGFVYPGLRSNMEQIAAGSVEAAQMADLVIPSDTETDTITEAWRLTARGRTWNIRRVTPPVDGEIRMVVESGTAT